MLVEALEQDLNADVETGLAAAADASRAAGWREVETRCYDALIAACCSDQPIDAVAGAGRHIVPGDAVGQRLIAAFGRDFGPGGQNEDLYIWSRLLGARYKIYGDGGKNHDDQDRPPLWHDRSWSSGYLGHRHVSAYGRKIAMTQRHPDDHRLSPK